MGIKLRYCSLLIAHCLMVMSFIFTSCRSENPTDGVTTTYKVAFISPQSMWDSERSIVAGALATIDRAQRGLTRRVGIEVEWIDEDAPDLSNGVKCTFIPESAWPENAGAAEEILNEQYYLGAVVKKEKDEGFGSGWFVVIAPWTPQECGLMVKIEKDSYYYNAIPKKKCSGAGTLHRVYRELHKGSNYHDIFEVIGQQEEVNWPITLNGSYLSKTKKGAAHILVNLESNSEKYYNPDNGRYIDSAPARIPAASDKMRMIYCYCFKPNGDKIKFW